MPRPRWTLQAEAIMWRNLMDIGMRLHCMASPSAPTPSFTQYIPSTISAVQGNIPLQFYVPETYARGENRLFPVVINFHGGGFTIGKATDDARWARAVVEYIDAVVVSVDYRLAPEHPFPIAIEDGVDATLYLIEHSEELRIDPHRIAYSGFSAGGNMAFSVPIRLEEEFRKRGMNEEKHTGVGDSGPKRGTVVAISAWYPSIDYSNSREERRKTNVRSDKELPKFFTDLFDASYLYPLKDVDVRSPWLSPGIAPDHMIRQLPENIVIYACEWDALCAETERFHHRLVDDFGKKVVFKKVMGACHAFDKTPNPFNWDPKIETMYRDACREMRTVFYGSSSDDAVLAAREEGKQGPQGTVSPRIEVTRLPHSDESLARVQK
ncbi:hypothetical protein VKT23_001561 [Stygiomarasmius scandens]|uniref:Alpha/beta hydrolase fold-3 domain-containing protein n=1 Tax=Marasmiellus scandens TaxID=2682957 RepID=A0ABR1K309_9AGAR